MRVTNTMMVSNFLRDLGYNQERMAKYQSQMATTRQIVRLSDDPVGAITTLSARSKLRDIETYQRSVKQAQTWLTDTETAASEINSIIKRARELTTQAANETNEAIDKKAISAELEQLRQHFVTTVNSTMVNKYVFGGYNVSQAPFATYTDPDYFEYVYDEFDNVMADPNDPTQPLKKTYPEVKSPLEGTLVFNGKPMYEVYDAAGNALVGELSQGNVLRYSGAAPSPGDPKSGLTMAWVAGTDLQKLTDQAYTGFNTGTLKAKDALESMQQDIIKFKVGFELEFDVSVNGLDLIGIGENNIYKMFSDVTKYLDGTHPDIKENSGEAFNEHLRPMIGKFAEAQERVLSSIADVGARQNRLDLYADRYSYDAINYESMRSEVEDLDMEKAITNFSMAEAVYKAALSVGARVIQPTLIDFLR
ncbi:flagellar hook-associated protein FlgL [Oscillospiraceae bacterium OttesenSCG-928-F05]|nr:flagellar hook-associated protein FlgL [Oscillospiraceae bacterium OttesenSCG-928-F05]